MSDMQPVMRAGATDSDYVGWIRAHLPKWISPGARSMAGSLCGWVRGLEFWIPGDRGPDQLDHRAESEDELLYWLFRQSCIRGAQEMELKARPVEESRFRYVADHAENGRWIYRQNPVYEFNTIHDSRKCWMELALKMAAPSMPWPETEAMAAEFERLLNNNYRIPHWGYDWRSGSFREVRDTPYVDWEGVPQPEPGTVIGVDHP